MAVELIAGEKVKGESSKAIIACNDYLRMGPGRSLRSLLSRYREVARSSAPTHNQSTLQMWSVAYSWQVRAESYDAANEAEKQVRAEARRREIMEEGLALDYERVAKLKDLADMLETEINYEPAIDSEQSLIAELEAEALDPYDRALQAHSRRRPNVWLRDVKGIGSFENFERVEIVRFNAALIAEYRGTLDDLAKESGGRHHTVEMTGKDGKDLNLQTQVHFYLPDNGREGAIGAPQDNGNSRKD